MLSLLKLRQFRGFQALEVACRPVTAVLGPNSSGKTSLLAALRFACDALRMAIDHPEVRPSLKDGLVHVCDRLILSDIAAFFAVADWRQVFTDAVVGEGASLGIHLDFTTRDPLQSINVELHYGRNAQPLLSVQVASQRIAEAVKSLPSKSVHRPQRLRDELRRIAPLSYFVPPFYGVMRTEEYRALPVVTRLLSAGDQSHIVRNLIARLDGGAIERLNAFLGQALGASIARRTSQMEVEQVPELAVHYRDTNGELELSTAGAGLISLIAIYAAMERSRQERAHDRDRSVLFLLDEPEAHLHPRLQGDVGDALADLARDVGVQLVLATHSIEMINRLGRRPEAALISVDRRTSTAIELRSDTDVLDALDDFCDLTPFTSLNFLASRRILFYEGPTDLKILEACARVLFAKNDAARARWDAYTKVSLDGVSNVSMRGVLERVISPSIFPRQGQGAPVRAVLAQDRDYHRAPERAHQELSAEGHLLRISVVWSRHSIESLFLDRDCLTEWLANVSGGERRIIMQLVEAGIAAANADRELEDHAIDGLMPMLRRSGARGEHARGQVLTEQQALQQARARARAEPEVWQRGKDRARRILELVRGEAQRELRPRIRGSVVDLLERVHVDRVADVTAYVPLEVREFLELVAAP